MSRCSVQTLPRIPPLASRMLLAAFGASAMSVVLVLALAAGSLGA